MIIKFSSLSRSQLKRLQDLIAEIVIAAPHALNGLLVEVENFASRLLDIFPKKPREYDLFNALTRSYSTCAAIKILLLTRKIKIPTQPVSTFQYAEEKDL